MYTLEKRPIWMPQAGSNYFLPYAEKPKAFNKLASELHPEVEAWLRSWKPNPKYQVVVIAPLGASEVWGMNSNGDWFPEEQLNPRDTSSYGYKTFENANLYEHHANKDKTKSRGRIPLAVWNSRMQRAEVIAINDRAACEALGSGRIVGDIDSGNMPPVSMGTRVAYDICSVCGNKAYRVDQYCEHLKHRMGHTLPDGTAVYAINIRPKFFDLSYVHVPAAKESGVLAKVASVGTSLLSEISKPRTVKAAAVIKAADIEKRVLTNTIRKRLISPMVRSEAPMCGATTRALDGHPLRRILGTLGFGGGVLSPREFTILIIRKSNPDLAQRIPQNFSLPWSMPHRGSMQFGSRDFSPGLFSLLRGLLGARSFYPRSMATRIHALRRPTAAIAPAPPVMKIGSVLPEIELQKLANLYGDYRASLVDSLINNFDAVRKDYPSILNTSRDALFKGLTDSKVKLATTKLNFGGLAQTTAAVYLLNAHLAGGEVVGSSRLGKLEQFVEGTPSFSTGLER